MQAMVLDKLGTALARTDLPDRPPGPGEIRGQVAACSARRTDLHAIDRELRGPEAIEVSSACIDDRQPPLATSPRHAMRTKSFGG